VLCASLRRFPEVRVSGCPHAQPFTRRPAHERSVALAHRAVWQAAHDAGCRRIVVLERDATPAGTPEEALEAALAAASARLDFVYLGACYDTGSRPPLCMHAYVASGRALSRLLAALPPDACAPQARALPPVDHLLQHVLHPSRGLTWTALRDPPSATAHWTTGAFHQLGAEAPDS
jgi:hypothetical protein